MTSKRVVPDEFESESPSKGNDDDDDIENNTVNQSRQNRRKRRSSCDVDDESTSSKQPCFKRPRTIRTRSMSREEEEMKKRMRKTPKEKKQIQNVDDKCPNCENGGEMVSDIRQGCTYCRRCGEVLDQRVVSEEVDWRLVNNGETELENSRVGATRNYMIDEFRRRMISKRKRDSSEDDEEEDTPDDDCVVSSYNPHSDVRSLLRRMERMKKVCELKDLSKKVVDYACQFFAHLSSMRPKDTGKDARRHSMNVLMAASLYTACRFSRVPVTRREICSPFKASNRGTQCAFLLNVLAKDLSLNIARLTSLDFLPRICSSLNLSPALGKIARTICIRIRDSKQFDTGVSAPATTAASALYVAAHMRNLNPNDNLKEKDLIELLDLKSSSWRRRCCALIERLDCILKEEDFSNFRRLGLCASRLGRVLKELKRSMNKRKKSKRKRGSKTTTTSPVRTCNN